MFNHSLEHVSDPIAELRSARERVCATGYVLVRIPTTSSDAWKEYGVDWFQLDAPRHLAIPSREGFRMAAAEAGFELVYSEDDSNEQQFRLSELYRSDVALSESHREPVNDQAMLEYKMRAKAVNFAQRGDQVIFVLKPL